MNKYPKRVNATNWLIEVRDTNGKYKELMVKLEHNSLYQMGWDLGKEINNEQN